MKDALMTPAGLGYITGTGLSAQHENQQAYEDYLLAMEEERKQRARDIAEYYPENIPYAGGGSIYKNRYINGNWSQIWADQAEFQYQKTQTQEI